MGPDSRWFAFRLAIVCTLALVTNVFAGDAPWIEIRSPHFSVLTDAGERRGREAALRFEQMRAVFGTLMVKAKVNLPVPLQIIAFRNRKEMRQVSPLWQGKPTEVSGLFQGGEDRCFIMLDMSVENPWQVVFHEYAHQLMAGNLDADADPWFEEGFAEYFSSIAVDGKQAHVGKIPPETYLILGQTAWLRAADLFRVQHYSKTYNESGDHRTVFYAESALLMHYLYENGLIPKVGDYFALVREKKVPVEDAIQQAFGMSAAQLEKALRNYYGAQRFKYYQLPAPAGMDSKSYTSAPVAPTDVQAVIADIHLRSADYRNQAAAEFEAVLKVDPNNASALRGLGYYNLIKQDYQRAREYFHQAIEKNANDSRVLYYSALLAQREGISGGDPEQLAVMQKELETSIKLDPEFADAYSLLAFTYMTQGKKDDGLRTMIKAVELNPGNEQYRFNLAEMCLYTEKFDAATKILKGLENSPNPEVAARSTQELARIEQYRQQRAFAESAQPVAGPSATMAHPSVIGPEPMPLRQVEPPKFLKGKLLSVDCAALPAAVLTIAEGARTWRMHTADTSHTIVIGADTFSCEWKNQKVAVNYRPTAENEGNLVSVEIQ